jgi:hypothetical protein
MDDGYAGIRLEQGEDGVTQHVPLASGTRLTTTTDDPTQWPLPDFGLMTAAVAYAEGAGLERGGWLGRG